jgi:hypothetical protein
VSAGPEVDAPRSAADGVAADALTYAFADATADVCGVARLGLADGRASGLAFVLRGGETASVRAEGGAEGDVRAWEALRVAGLRTESTRPERTWRVVYEGDGDGPGFDLAFEASSPPIALDGASPVGRAGGMAGVDRLCRVHGSVGGDAFEGLGQRSRAWGRPDWERMTVARTLSAWLDAGHAITCAAVRPVGARGHGDEAIAAFGFDAELAEPVTAFDEARLSTVYDADGRQRRVGLELLVDDDPYARRAAGEVVAGTSLDLGRLRLDCAFVRWRTEGRLGVGRYDVLRRR